MSKELENLKIRVSGVVNSLKIQDRLFGMGYGWMGESREHLHYEEPFLFADSDGCITYATLGSEGFFKRDTSREVTLEELSNPSERHGYAEVLEAIARGEDLQWSDITGEWYNRSGETVLKDVANAIYLPKRYRIKPDTKVIGQWEAKYTSIDSMVYTAVGGSEEACLETIEMWKLAISGIRVIQEPRLVEYEVEV